MHNIFADTDGVWKEIVDGHLVPIEISSFEGYTFYPGIEPEANSTLLLYSQPQSASFLVPWDRNARVINDYQLVGVCETAATMDMMQRSIGTSAAQKFVDMVFDKWGQLVKKVGLDPITLPQFGPSFKSGGYRGSIKLSGKLEGLSNIRRTGPITFKKLPANKGKITCSLGIKGKLGASFSARVTMKLPWWLPDVDAGAYVSAYVKDFSVKFSITACIKKPCYGKPLVVPQGLKVNDIGVDFSVKKRLVATTVMIAAKYAAIAYLKYEVKNQIISYITDQLVKRYLKEILEKNNFME